jgi:RHS repeat-associated protein
LAVYDNTGNTNNWREQQLYGSSRLGMWKPNLNLATANGSSIWNSYGLKFFELSNHLGNVMAVVSDNRLQTGSTYEADVINSNDYYAFGGQMKGRDFTNPGAQAYRYGFNGKENDNEVKGTGNQQDYGMRIYDPRIGKFLSVDPLQNQFPWFSSFQYAGNNPISFIDLDGAEPKKKSVNYGKSVIIGLVYVKSLSDSYLSKNFKAVNRNWLGKTTDMNGGLKYIQSLSDGMRETTELTNVIFNTHGGITALSKQAGFLPNPSNSKEQIVTADIKKFVADRDDESLIGFKKESLSSLESIFAGMKKGGTFILSACNVGEDIEFGKALQALSKGRINILITPDRVRISDPNSNDYADELVKPKIQDRSIWKNKKNWYKEGFILFPLNNAEPIKLDKNIIINPEGDEAIKKVEPVKKK